MKKTTITYFALIVLLAVTFYFALTHGASKVSFTNLTNTQLNILFNDLCLKENLKTHLFSAVKIDTFIDYYTVRDVNNSLSNNEICIFCGGTGSAFFTTDTGAALRAAETNTN